MNRVTRFAAAAVLSALLAACPGVVEDDEDNGDWDTHTHGPGWIDAPGHDLAGRWRAVEPVRCTTDSADLSDIALAELDSRYEAALLNRAIHISQWGSDLELVYLDTNARFTISASGGSLSFTYSEQTTVRNGVVADLYREVEGAIHDDNRIAITIEEHGTRERFGAVVAVETTCTYDLVRVDG